jgi:hypothetical protein
MVRKLQGDVDFKELAQYLGLPEPSPDMPRNQFKFDFVSLPKDFQQLQKQFYA